MFYRFCARTDTGRIRSNNEDAVAMDAALGLALLADGMGGCKAGEIASNMATSHIQAALGAYLRQSLDQNPCLLSNHSLRQVLETSVASANTTILQAARANADYAGMGTTLVVAVFCHGRLLLGHIGDSRCYRYRAGKLLPITHDHSMVQAQLDAGWVTPAQARLSQDRNMLTRALGVEDTVQLEVNEFPLQAGDLYLLCSDGLTDMLLDATIAKLLASHSALEQKAQSLIHAANAQGGRDNISVLLAEVVAVRS
ncbi:MAG: Stp1/IreP family PP2C-type Ser/Thr phosphatase [Rhodoferax sp.]|nr:Stp1/IreP family PP2C-type Ser/Thr phosphatase [Rhodoferax sp.]